MSSTTPDKRALLEAYHRAIESEAEKAAAERRAATVQRRRVPLLVTFGLGFVATVALAIALTQPLWLFPERAIVETIEQSDATVRAMIAMEAERIEAFRRTRNRLPATLADVPGRRPPALEYRVLAGNRYELAGTHGGATARYRSDEPLDRFLGTTYATIRARGAK